MAGSAAPQARCSNVHLGWARATGHDACLALAASRLLLSLLSWLLDMTLAHLHCVPSLVVVRLPQEGRHCLWQRVLQILPYVHQMTAQE